MATLATAPELIAHLRLDERDLEVDGLEIWNEDGTATSATVKVDNVSIILTQVGGANPSVVTLVKAAYVSMTTLITTIELAPSEWRVRLLVPEEAEPTNLSVNPSETALGYASRVPLQIVDVLWLNTLLDKTVGRIEGYCHRTFPTTVYTDEEYSGLANDVIILRNYPVTAFTRLQHRSNQVWADVVATSYRLDLDDGLIYHRTGAFTAGNLNYRATFTAGYVTIPAELHDLCLDIAAQYYYSGGRDPRLKSDRLGMYARSLFEGELGSGLEGRMNLWMRMDG